MPAESLAVRFAAPERAELVADPAEERPLKDTEVAGRTLVSLVSAGTELASYRGLIGAFPKSSGYAAVFEVDAVGSAVPDLKPGDRVFCMGNHRLLQRADRRECAPVPAGLEPERAVFARMMGITMSTLVTTTARPPDLVAVTGLGVVGSLGAQLFAASGYRVLACDPVESRREAARRAGLTDVREAIPLDDPEVKGRVALVLECSGHEAAVLAGCRAVRRRGEVVLVGVPWEKRAEMPAFDILHAVFHSYAVLRSGWEWEVPRQREDFRTGSLFENFRAAMEWIAAGRVRVDGLWEARSPRDCQAAYQDLLKGRCARLSVLFDWQGV
ncbi:MAG TPA: zinc-binding alcohol dehydrogenase [Planctomycetota bacterium]|nr:zinc-binding alcohol dehydrogenase [Planctomycetota bacterium]